MLSGVSTCSRKGLTFLTAQARRGLNSTGPYAHAMLARVQAQLGQAAEARATYQKFFEIWKDADPDLPRSFRRGLSTTTRS